MISFKMEIFRLIFLATTVLIPLLTAARMEREDKLDFEIERLREQIEVLLHHNPKISQPANTRDIEFNKQINRLQATREIRATESTTDSTTNSTSSKTSRSFKGSTSNTTTKTNEGERSLYRDLSGNQSAFLDLQNQLFKTKEYILRNEIQKKEIRAELRTISTLLTSRQLTSKQKEKLMDLKSQLKYAEMIGLSEADKVLNDVVPQIRATLEQIVEKGQMTEDLLDFEIARLHGEIEAMLRLNPRILQPANERDTEFNERRSRLQAALTLRVTSSSTSSKTTETNLGEDGRSLYRNPRATRTEVITTLRNELQKFMDFIMKRAFQSKEIRTEQQILSTLLTSRQLTRKQKEKLMDLQKQLKIANMIRVDQAEQILNDVKPEIQATLKQLIDRGQMTSATKDLKKLIRKILRLVTSGISSPQLDLLADLGIDRRAVEYFLQPFEGFFDL